ncbi:MAG: hypothetical protein LBF57_01990 [Holosporaceae bacterium]|nr:hypothetical protein [Holosporaceae bacterium]
MIYIIFSVSYCNAMNESVYMALHEAILASFSHIGITEDYRMYGYEGISSSKLHSNTQKAFRSSYRSAENIEKIIQKFLSDNIVVDTNELYLYKDDCFAGYYRKWIHRSILIYISPSICDSVLKELYSGDPLLIINGTDDFVIKHMTFKLSKSLSDMHSRQLLLEHLIGAERSKCVNLGIRNISFPASLSNISHVPLLRTMCNQIGSQLLEKVYNQSDKDNLLSDRVINFARTNWQIERNLFIAQDNNHQLLTRKFREKISTRNMHVTPEVEEQAINKGIKALLIQLPISNNITIIRTLFHHGMFHLFSPAEDIFMMHLHPKKQGWFKNILSKVIGSQVETLFQTDKIFWLECITGVMRSRAIRDYILNPIDQISLGKFLGLSTVSEPATMALPPKLDKMYSGTHSKYGSVISRLDYIDFASRVARTIYTEEGLGSVIDPEMRKDDTYAWSKIPEETYRSLTNAFTANKITATLIVDTEIRTSTIQITQEIRDYLIDQITGGMILSLPADHAMTLIYSLFPEGLFHLFNGAEFVLMNHLQPTGRDLTPAERLFYLECLAGTRRAQSINEGIANPVRGFSLEVFPHYRIIK